MRARPLIALLVLLSACATPDQGKPGAEPGLGDDGADSVPDGGTEGGGDGTPDTDSAPDTDTGPGWSPDDDSDGDGLTDGEEGRADEDPRDSDGDGVPDYLDEDSDDDGVPDAIESQPRDDDGLPADSDGDGTPDHLDRDSDDDGLLDIVEGASDDGVPPDTDGDGVPDMRDWDSDADGLLDRLERLEDWDGDGIPNAIDTLNDGGVPALPFTAISTAFNSPIGIDYHEHSGTVVLTVNYPSGNPLAFERVQTDGTHVAFSGVTGLTNEVKIATARTGAAGFAPGELFVGNGIDGQIVRISPDGSSVQNPWVDLPGDGNGLARGSLYVDRTGVWGNELLVATTAGELWRIDASGNPTLIADVDVHLEGLATVPDAPARYGPLAGKAIAGAENEGLLYVFDTSGAVGSYNVGVAVEDVDIVVPHENFFGVNYGTSRLIGVPAEDLLPMAGDILLTQESVTSVGLFHLRYDGTDLIADELTAASGSATIGQWEHVTTAAAGIQEVPE